MLVAEMFPVPEADCSFPPAMFYIEFLFDPI